MPARKQASRRGQPSNLWIKLVRQSSRKLGSLLFNAFRIGRAFGGICCLL